MRLSAYAAALSLLVAAQAAHAAPFAVPAKLVAASGGAAAGKQVEVSADAAGIIDRNGVEPLRLSKTAFDAATSDDERLVLMAMSLSYKVGMRSAPGPLDKGFAGVVAGVVAAAVEDGLAARDRADPYLQLPSTPRAGRRLPEPSPTGAEPLALRGLAWATAAGVCEATALAYLDRLATLQADDATIASDARALRRGLGMIAYNPRSDCRAG